MKTVDIGMADGFFDVVAGTERSQAATMVLSAGQSTGGPENRHEADQWLSVVSGTGTVTADTETHDLEPELLVLIEAGEPHEIRNTGTDPLRTVAIYAPPAY